MTKGPGVVEGQRYSLHFCVSESKDCKKTKRQRELEFHTDYFRILDTLDLSDKCLPWTKISHSKQGLKMRSLSFKVSPRVGRKAQKLQMVPDICLGACQTMKMRQQVVLARAMFRPSWRTLRRLWPEWMIPKRGTRTARTKERSRLGRRSRREERIEERKSARKRPRSRRPRHELRLSGSERPGTLEVHQQSLTQANRIRLPVVPPARGGARQRDLKRVRASQRRRGAQVVPTAAHMELEECKGLMARRIPANRMTVRKVMRRQFFARGSPPDRSIFSCRSMPRRSQEGWHHGY